MVIGCPFTSWWIVENRSSFSYLGRNRKMTTNNDFSAYFVQFLKSLFCDLIPSSMWWDFNDLPRDNDNIGLNKRGHFPTWGRATYLSTWGYNDLKLMLCDI
jgi:hypothetical protein